MSVPLVIKALAEVFTHFCFLSPEWMLRWNMLFPSLPLSPSPRSLSPFLPPSLPFMRFHFVPGCILVMNMLLGPDCLGLNRRSARY